MAMGTPYQNPLTVRSLRCALVSVNLKVRCELPWEKIIERRYSESFDEWADKSRKNLEEWAGDGIRPS
jgi:hypothetical protein